VLAIACANVPVFCSRAPARGQRNSDAHRLGAGRLRLMRQVITESVLLAVLAACWAVLRQGRHASDSSFMRLRKTRSPSTLLPTPVCCFHDCGRAIPADCFLASPRAPQQRIDLATALKGTAGSVAGNASMQRLNQALVVVQVALSRLGSFGADICSHTRKTKRDWMQASIARISLFDLDFYAKDRPARCAALYNELLARLRRCPVFVRRSFSTFYLLSGGSWRPKSHRGRLHTQS